MNAKQAREQSGNFSNDIDVSNTIKIIDDLINKKSLEGGNYVIYPLIGSCKFMGNYKENNKISNHYKTKGFTSKFQIKGFEFSFYIGW